MIADNKYKSTLTALSNLPDDAIHQMAEFPQKAIKELEDNQAQFVEDEGNERKVIELCLTVTISEEASESLESEMEKLRKNMGI